MIILITSIILGIYIIYYCNKKLNEVDQSSWNVNARPDIAHEIALEYKIEQRLRESAKVGK